MASMPLVRLSKRPILSAARKMERERGGGGEGGREGGREGEREEREREREREREAAAAACLSVRCGQSRSRKSFAGLHRAVLMPHATLLRSRRRCS
jgi:hypothetical protein